MCLHFRKINEITIKDSYPLPRVSEIFSKLHGAKFLTSLDFKDAYWL